MTWEWSVIVLAAAVVVVVVAALWTRRARAVRRPTVEADHDPSGASRGVRVSATVVLAVLAGVMVLALLAFTIGRIVTLGD